MDEGYFDYRHATEEKDELDFENLLPCPHCKKPIPADATMCLYCGKEVNRQAYGMHSWVVWAAIVLIIIFAIFAISSIY